MKPKGNAPEAKQRESSECDTSVTATPEESVIGGRAKEQQRKEEEEPRTTDIIF